MRSLGKKYSNSEAVQKLMKYCAYQERCHQEVKNKLFDWGFKGEDIDDILVRLIDEDFINEERFARAFCRGKFRQKKWGRLKIIQGLKEKGISANLVKLALLEIEEDRYRANLKYLIQKKSSLLKEKDSYKRNHKLANYAISKGYEVDLVWDEIRNQIESN
ncbi:MAG: RecX family transcriptional regulator [Bacteroidetes bacterium]|nr:RecX family transcriptional regulator [Bacteroidota bacterium]